MPTVTSNPAVSGDDGSWHNIGAGSFSATQSNITVGDADSGNHDRWAFIRFPNVTVPQGATITAAKVSLRAGGLTGTIPALTIDGNAIDTAVAPANRTAANGLAHTTANTPWTPSAWVTNTRYDSPDIAAVVEEITDRAGWASGNALLLFVKVALDGFTSAQLVSFNGQDGGVPANTAELSVTYTTFTPNPYDGKGLVYHMNRKAGTLVNDRPTLPETAAANVWAGTTGYELVGALNIIAGNAHGNYRELMGVLNQLAGTTGLDIDAAAASIP